MAEEEQCQKEEKKQRQKDLAYQLKVDCIAAMEQAHRKNWVKTFLLPPSPPFDKEMNLIDLLPLTKRQCLHYLPKETLEARQQRKELAREIRASVVSRSSSCERCADFGILCIP